MVQECVEKNSKLWPSWFQDTYILLLKIICILSFKRNKKCLLSNQYLDGKIRKTMTNITTMS